MFTRLTAIAGEAVVDVATLDDGTRCEAGIASRPANDRNRSISDLQATELGFEKLS